MDAISATDPFACIQVSRGSSGVRSTPASIRGVIASRRADVWSTSDVHSPWRN